MKTQTEHLHEILTCHFDPRWGTPFWLEERTQLAFDPVAEIRSINDLNRFPAFPVDQLAARPVTDFIPLRYHDQLERFVTAETGGTTGPPKRTAYLDADFEAAFVAPFVAAAAMTGVPRRSTWLVIGPSGPHIIGKAARACARALDSIDPFSVDFDPRWIRRLAPGSMARSRYTEHLLDQAEAVLRTQEIGVLFATPPVLEALAARLPDARREAIRGIHLGGMAAGSEFRTRLAREYFPNAISLSGYGNALAGVCPELLPNPEQPPTYFAHGPRLLLGISTPDNNGRGRVLFHRLDRSAFFPKVLERDVAVVAPRPEIPGSAAFQPLGLRDPRPSEEDAGVVSAGLY